MHIRSYAALKYLKIKNAGISVGKYIGAPAILQIKKTIVTNHIPGPKLAKLKREAKYKKTPIKPK